MNYFHFNIADYEVAKSNGQIQSVPAGFIDYKETMSGASMYYKIENSKITEVIAEAIHEDAARRRVEEFLDGFNAGLV